MQHLALLLALPSLLSLALAAPARTIQLDSLTSSTNTDTTPANVWCASDFWESCGNAGCVYQFNLTKAASNSTQFGTEPAFSTVCNGTNIQNKMNPCTDPTISTNALPGPSTETIVVQHTWEAALSDGSGDVAIFTATGNTTLVGFPFPTSFEVPVLTETAIA